MAVEQSGSDSSESLSAGSPSANDSHLSAANAATVQEAVRPSTRTGSADIASQLRRDIRRGDYEALDRLPPERTLAEHYKVARGTVREALNRLASEGLVEIRAGSGTYIRTPDVIASHSIIAAARPLELIDTRFALEPHICRLAVLHARPQDFEDMEALLELMESCADDPISFSRADADFHRTLANSTGNSLLIWIVEQINSVRGQDQWSQMRKLTLHTDIIGQYNHQHRQILNAIRTREPERAASLMKEHLEAARLSLTRASAT